MAERIEQGQRFWQLEGGHIAHHFAEALSFACECCAPRVIFRSGRGYCAFGAAERHEFEKES